MLARDWYYNQRRQLGLDSAVASIYDRHDDSDLRARAALSMLGVQKGWRLADIGCGNGVLACEAALLGAERDVDQWADFTIKNHDFQREGVVTHMRDEYSTFGWVIERMLTDVGFTLESVDYHAPLHGTYLLRKPKPDQQS